MNKEEKLVLTPFSSSPRAPGRNMYILQIRRLSDSYYSYSVELWNARKGKLVDYEFCGDLSYWGKEGTKRCDEIEAEFKAKYSITSVIECGLLTGKPCPFF